MQKPLGTLPAPLEHSVIGRSRNELVAMALRRELAAQERAAIDAAFAAMADDPAYHAEARELAAAFAAADWEALRLAEEGQ